MTIKANATPLEMWRRAQAEATSAYYDWCAARGQGFSLDKDAYRNYRAAQDRADAAQDELANTALATA